MKTFLILIALWGAPYPAQAEPLFRTVPPASRIRLEGPVRLGGTAPLDLRDVPSGRYRLLAGGGTGALSRAHLTWDGAGSMRLHGYAGASSLVTPPGLGHLTRGESRGRMFLLAGTGGAAGALLGQVRYQRADDRVGDTHTAYLDAVDESAITGARIEYQVANRWRRDKEEVRNLWLGYAAYAWVGAGLELWLLTPSPSLTAMGDGYALGIPGRGGAAAGIRSLLVPGAGQRALGHEGRGTRFLFATALSGAAALVAHDVYLDHRRDQYEAQLRYDAARTGTESETRRAVLEREADDVKTWDTLRWTAVGVTGALWLWNVVDAVALSGKTPSARGLGWMVTPTPDGVTAVLAWRIG